MCNVTKSFICRGCLNPVTSTGHTSVDIDASENLELVDKFRCLGDMLGVDGDADELWRIQNLNLMVLVQAVAIKLLIWIYRCL